MDMNSETCKILLANKNLLCKNITTTGSIAEQLQKKQILTSKMVSDVKVTIIYIVLFIYLHFILANTYRTGNCYANVSMYSFVSDQLASNNN